MIGAVPAGAVTAQSSIRPETGFADVSCPSVGNCTAVGSFGQLQSPPFTDPNVQPVHATETDGVWGRAVTVAAPGGNPGVFTSVSCYAVGSCTAVGYTYSGGYDLHGGEPSIGYPLYEVETNGTWGPVRELTKVTGQATTTVGGLFSVSCGSDASCVAVGAGQFGLAALVATESNGVFAPATFVGTPTGSGYFDSVSCSTATDCTAVGGDTVYDGDFGVAFANASIAATETAGTWGSAVEIDAKANLVSFGATTCTAPSTCTAVSGSSYVTETAGSWGPAKKLVWPGTGGVNLSGIDCSSSGDCTAVGESDSAAFSTIGTVSVHVTERAGAWGSVKADGGGIFADVSCPTATTCSSVGDFDVCEGVAECNAKSIDPVYTSEVAGVWPAVPRPPSIRRVTPVDGRATVVDGVDGPQGAPSPRVHRHRHSANGRWLRRVHVHQHDHEVHYRRADRRSEVHDHGDRAERSRELDRLLVEDEHACPLKGGVLRA